MNRKNEIEIWTPNNGSKRGMADLAFHPPTTISIAHYNNNKNYIKLNEASIYISCNIVHVVGWSIHL